MSFGPVAEPNGSATGPCHHMPAVGAANIVRVRLKVLAVPVLAVVLAACGSKPSPAASKSTTTTSSSTTTTSSTTTSSSTTTTSPQSGVAPSTATASYTRSGGSPSYSVTISYPVLGGMVSTAAQTRINSQIIASVAGWANSFVQNVSSITGSSVQGNSTLTGAYKTVLVDSKVASFQFVLNSDVVSAAQPSTNIYSLNFNLSNGATYALGDLFKAGSNYLSALSQAAITQLTAQLAAQHIPAVELQNDPGLSPAPANFAAFNIASGSLVLGFSQGQVIGTAIGALTVNIPDQALSQVIAPNGPLANS